MKLENKNLEILSSEARVASVNSVDLKSKSFNGLHLIIDVTAVDATPSVVPTIQGKDAVSGKYYTLLTGAAITTTGTTILKVFPGATVASNVSANDHLPAEFRISLAHADADSITYSVSANLF